MRCIRSLVMILVLLVQPVVAVAREIPVPSQAEWADAKKSVDLPNGQTIAYVEMGDTQGKPLLLIHGYTDNSRSWSLVAPFLKARHVFAIDLRGHGKSAAPDCCYAITDLANDASLFLDAVGVNKADVVGHSLGSMTAQMLSATHPEKVDHLVLVSSSLKPGGGPGSWLWDNIMPLQPPIDPNGKFMTDWYWNPNPVDTGYIERERAESAAVPIKVWRGVLWGLSAYDFSNLAPTIKAPMLIFWGDQDQLFDAKHQDALKKAYPSAQFEAFTGAGHNMFWEFPEKVATSLDGFLGKP
ncbi:alpha/beta hydrolase [Mesorhizobium loti]|nr:alpha/beta hydrolase [Mesorhizobium loti]PLP56344.1 alpha/beta hydrolase [Mesorhizobium loti]